MAPAVLSPVGSRDARPDWARDHDRPSPGPDPARRDVVLVTEGTYPHAHGGVSVWCDQLVSGLPDQPFRVVALTAFGHQHPVWDLPGNVRDLRTVGLWDHGATAARPRTRGRQPETSPLASALVARLAAPHDDVGWFGALVDRLSGLDPVDVAQQLSFAPLLTALDAMVRLPQAGDTVQAAHASDLVVVADILDHLLRPLGVDPGPARVYHASSNGLAALVCMVASRRHDAPFLLTEHGIYLRERYLELRRLALARPARGLLLRFHRLVTATAYARAAVVAPGSRWNVRWEARHGTPPDAVQTIYNGVDPADLPARAVEPDEPVVSWLGRVDPIKDLETLVAAFALVHERRPDARLRLYGRTPPGNESYRGRLDQLVAELGLEGIVTFEGGVAHSADAYVDAQLGVLSSISEGFPYSLIEAMACGLPAVATGVGGVSEAVADTGLVVVPRSPELLADAMVELLDDGPRRRDLGVAARARVLEHFTVATCLDQYRDLYARIVAMPRVRLRPVPARPPEPATTATGTATAARAPTGSVSGMWRAGTTSRSQNDGGFAGEGFAGGGLAGDDVGEDLGDGLDDDQRDELVAAVGGPEALAQAVDVDEVAATLESVGVTDRIAEVRFAAADVFDLAARVWTHRDRREPPRQVPPPRPQPAGAAARGVACVLPAVCVAATVLAGADQGALVAASVAAWGLGQAGGVLAYTAMHRGVPKPPRDLGPLRHGLAAATAAVGLVGAAVTRLASPIAGLTATLPLLYVVAVTGLVVAGRRRAVLGALAPVTVVSSVVIAQPSGPLTHVVGPLAILTVTALLVAVGLSAARGSPPRHVLQPADWLASLPLAASGWCSAGFAVLAVCAVGYLPGLAPGDSRQWLLLASPLWVTVAGSEWCILAARRGLAAELEASGSVAAYRIAAARLVVNHMATGVAALGAASLAGAGLAQVVAGVPFPAGVTAASIFAAVAAALHGSTVLTATSRPLPVLGTMAAAGAALAWLALTSSRLLGLGDPHLALAIAGLAAVALCTAAGRALVDPASHR